MALRERPLVLGLVGMGLLLLALRERALVIVFVVHRASLPATPAGGPRRGPAARRHVSSRRRFVSVHPVEGSCHGLLPLRVLRGNGPGVHLRGPILVPAP